MTTNPKQLLVATAMALSAIMSGVSPAMAEDPCVTNKAACVDWKRLKLTTQQTQQIDQLQQDWNTKYMKLQPQIVSLQQKMRTKFADPNSDPLEIMSTQQSLARLQEELRNEAMSNYLRKRGLLSDVQQRQLEGMMQQMVAERQQRMAPKTSHDEQNAGLMNIIHKVKWAIEPH